MCQRKMCLPFTWMWILWGVTWRRLWILSLIAFKVFAFRSSVTHPDLSKAPTLDLTRLNQNCLGDCLGELSFCNRDKELLTVVYHPFLCYVIYSSKNTIKLSDVCGRMMKYAVLAWLRLCIVVLITFDWIDIVTSTVRMPWG